MRPASQARAWRVCWSMGLWSRSPLPPRSSRPPYQRGKETRKSQRYGRRGAVRSVVEVPGPGMARELGEDTRREAAPVARGGVLADARGLAHARDHGGDRVVREAEAQSKLGQRPRLRPEERPQRLGAGVDLALAVAAEVVGPEIVRRKSRVRADLAGEPAFVEGHAREHAEAGARAGGQEALGGALVEDVV